MHILTGTAYSLYRVGMGVEGTSTVLDFKWVFDSLDFKVSFDRLDFKWVFDCLDFKLQIIIGGTSTVLPFTDFSWY